MKKSIRYLLFSLVILVCQFGCNRVQVSSFDFDKTSITPSQFFEVNNARDTTIRGQNGTKVFISKNSFGVEEGTVRVILQEFLDIPSMLLQGLTTMSNDAILETRGMISLIGISDGDTIRQSIKPIRIEIPSDNLDGDFRLFNGEITSKGVNWQLNQGSQYRFVANLRLSGLPSTGNDMTTDMIINDTVPIYNGLSRIDSITTFTGSNDTLNYWFVDYVLRDSTASSDYGLNMFILTTKLDWINIDRFIEFDELSTINLVTKTSGATSTFLVFKQINSILSVYTSIVNKLPTGQRVDIISFNQDGDQTYFSSMQNLLITDGMEVKLDYEELDAEMIKEKVKNLYD